MHYTCFLGKNLNNQIERCINIANDAIAQDGIHFTVWDLASVSVMHTLKLLGLFQIQSATEYMYLDLP